MTEAESLFRQTEKERKQLGYGAKHKKRGGGRYVRLFSDNLTKKEREALNGEVKTFKVKAFYAWEEFKKLPDDIQVGWVNSHVNVYGVGLETISTVVLGLSPASLRNYFARKDELKYINKAGAGGGARAAKKKLAAAVQQWKDTQVTMCEDDLPEKTEPEPAQEEGLREDQYSFKIVDHQIVPPEETTEPAETEKQGDLSNLGALIQALIGTGAKLTIEVTL